MEIWKDIKGYEGQYEVSTSGLIKSNKTNIILKPFKDTRGYKRVRLYNNGKYKEESIHRIVANTFLPKNQDEFIVDHIDNNKENNDLSNLQFISQRMNIIKEIDKSKKTSKYTGVYWSKWHSKWAARYSRKHLGFYEYEDKAGQAYISYVKNNNII